MMYGTPGQHPCFLLQVVFRGEGVHSHDATIICIRVFGLQNPTSLQFQNFTNLVSEKMFVQQTNVLINLAQSI
jgi:hypothetical protein